MEHRSARLRGTLLAAATLAAAVAATTAVLAPVAAAAPTAAPAATERVAHLKPAGAGGVSTRSASGGARSGDFTTDTIHDILARDARNGQLKVYPHAGEYHGTTATFQPATTINYGWGTMRWIGQGEMNGDGRNDVLYIDPYGVMRMAQHSGTWSGTGTLLSGVVIGTGWHINDLVYTDDFDADGFDDVLARRAGTGNVYWYRNSGLSGTAMFQAPQLAVSGTEGDLEQTMGDFTNDSVTDLLFIQSNGVLGLFDFVSGKTWAIGYGWQTINAITIADVTLDGAIDIVGRRKSDNALLVYENTAFWSPQPNGTAYSTLRAPVLIGYNWHINNVIT